MKHHLLTRPRTTVLLTALAMGLGSAGLVSLSSPALAAPMVKKGGPSVTLNFVNAEIEGVARAMGAILNRQIMVDPRVKGAITLYSDQPLTPREAYLNFLAALRGQGFALVEVAGLLKIVPEAEAKLQTGTVDVGAVRRSGDQVLTQIFRLQNESANNLVAVLRPLISPNNTINANPSSNTLVITDYADNLRRLGQMIAALDVPTSTDLEAIPLQHAVAVDLAPVVQRLADGGGAAPAAPGAGAGAAGTLVMADARTNTLMVRTPSPARMTLAVTSVAIPALYVFLLRGHDWQMDMHMGFFAALAAQTVLLHHAEGQVGAAVRAAPVDQTKVAAQILVEHQVLTQQPQRLGVAAVELRHAGHRHPVAP